MIAKESLDFYLEKVFRQEPLTDREYEELSFVLMRSGMTFETKSTLKLYLLGAVLPGVTAGFYGEKDAAEFLLDKIRTEGIGSADILLPDAPDADRARFFQRMESGQVKAALLPATLSTWDGLAQAMKPVDQTLGFNFVFGDLSTFADPAAGMGATDAVSQILDSIPSAFFFIAQAPLVMSLDAVAATVMKVPMPAARTAPLEPVKPSKPAAPPPQEPTTSVRPPAPKAAAIQVPGVTLEEQAELFKPLEPPPAEADAEEGMKTALREPLSQEQLDLLRQLDGFGGSESSSDSGESDLLSAVNVALGGQNEGGDFAMPGGPDPFAAAAAAHESQMAGLLDGDLMGSAEKASAAPDLLGDFGAAPTPDPGFLGASSGGIDFGAAGAGDLLAPAPSNVDLGLTAEPDLFFSPADTPKEALGQATSGSLGFEVETPAPAPQGRVPTATDLGLKDLVLPGLDPADFGATLMPEESFSFEEPPPPAPPSPTATAPRIAAPEDDFEDVSNPLLQSLEDFVGPEIKADRIPAKQEPAARSDAAPKSGAADSSGMDEFLPPLEELPEVEAGVEDLDVIDNLLHEKPRREAGADSELPEDLRDALMGLDDEIVPGDDRNVEGSYIQTVERPEYAHHDKFKLTEDDSKADDSQFLALDGALAESLDALPPEEDSSRADDELNALDDLLGKGKPKPVAETAPEAKDVKSLTASLLELEDEDSAGEAPLARGPAAPPPSAELAPGLVMTAGAPKAVALEAEEERVDLGSFDFEAPADQPDLPPLEDELPAIEAPEADTEISKLLGLDRTGPESLEPDSSGLDELADQIDLEPATHPGTDTGGEQLEDFSRLAGIVTGIISEGSSAPMLAEPAPAAELEPPSPPPAPATDEEIESQLKELIVDELMEPTPVQPPPAGFDDVVLESLSFEEPALVAPAPDDLQPPFLQSDSFAPSTPPEEPLVFDFSEPAPESSAAPAPEAVAPEQITQGLEELSNLFPDLGAEAPPPPPAPEPIPDVANLLEDLASPEPPSGEDALLAGLEEELAEPQPEPSAASTAGKGFGGELDDLFKIDLESLPPLPDLPGEPDLGPPPIVEPPAAQRAQPVQPPPPAAAPAQLAAEPMPGLIFDATPEDGYEDPLAGFAAPAPKAAVPPAPPKPQPPKAEPAPAPKKSEMDELFGADFGQLETPPIAPIASAPSLDFALEEQPLGLELPAPEPPAPVAPASPPPAGGLDDLFLADFDMPELQAQEELAAIAPDSPAEPAPGSELDFLLDEPVMASQEPPARTTPPMPEKPAWETVSEATGSAPQGAAEQPPSGWGAGGELDFLLEDPALAEIAPPSPQSAGIGAPESLPPLNLDKVPEPPPPPPLNLGLDSLPASAPSERKASPLDDIFGTPSLDDFDLEDLSGTPAGELPPLPPLEDMPANPVPDNAALPSLKGLLDSIEDDLRLPPQGGAPVAPPADAPAPARPTDLGATLFDDEEAPAQAAPAQPIDTEFWDLPESPSATSGEEEPLDFDTFSEPEPAAHGAVAPRRAATVAEPAPAKPALDELELAGWDEPAPKAEEPSRRAATVSEPTVDELELDDWIEPGPKSPYQSPESVRPEEQAELAKPASRRPFDTGASRPAQGERGLESAPARQPAGELELDDWIEPTAKPRAAATVSEAKPVVSADLDDLLGDLGLDSDESAPAERAAISAPPAPKKVEPISRASDDIDDLLSDLDGLAPDEADSRAGDFAKAPAAPAAAAKKTELAPGPGPAGDLEEISRESSLDDLLEGILDDSSAPSKPAPLRAKGPARLPDDLFPDDEAEEGLLSGIASRDEETGAIDLPELEDEVQAAPAAVSGWDDSDWEELSTPASAAPVKTELPADLFEEDDLEALAPAAPPPPAPEPPKPEPPPKPVAAKPAAAVPAPPPPPPVEAPKPPPVPEPVRPVPAAPAPASAAPSDLERLSAKKFDFPGIYVELRTMWDNPDSSIDPLLGLAPKMADLAPGDSSHQFIAGVLAHLQQHHSRAILYYEKAIALSESAGDQASVTFALERLHEILPGDPGVCQRLAEGYVRQERRAEACGLWREQGQRFLEGSSLTQSIAAYEQAHRLAPEDTDALLGLASAYRAGFNDLKAIEILNGALQADASNYRLHLSKGISLSRVGRAKAGESCIQRALDLAWHDSHALQWCEKELGDAGLGISQQRCRDRLAELDPEQAIVSAPPQVWLREPAPRPAAPELPVPTAPPVIDLPRAERTFTAGFLSELRSRVPRHSKKLESLEFLEREVTAGGAADARLAELLKSFISAADLFTSERPDDAAELYRRGQSYVNQLRDKALQALWAEEYQRKITRVHRRVN